MKNREETILLAIFSNPNCKISTSNSKGQNRRKIKRYNRLVQEVQRARLTEYELKLKDRYMQICGKKKHIDHQETGNSDDEESDAKKLDA